MHQRRRVAVDTAGIGVDLVDLEERTALPIAVTGEVGVARVEESEMVFRRQQLQGIPIGKRTLRTFARRRVIGQPGMTEGLEVPAGELDSPAPGRETSVGPGQAALRIGDPEPVFLPQEMVTWRGSNT